MVKKEYSSVFETEIYNSRQGGSTGAEALRKAKKTWHEPLLRSVLDCNAQDKAAEIEDAAELLWRRILSEIVRGRIEEILRCDIKRDGRSAPTVCWSRSLQAAMKR